MMSNCCKTHGGDAAALGTVWFSAKLTRGDNRFEIGGDGMGGTSEDTVRGRLRRI